VYLSLGYHFGVIVEFVITPAPDKPLFFVMKHNTGIWNRRW